MSILTVTLKKAVKMKQQQLTFGLNHVSEIIYLSLT